MHVCITTQKTNELKSSLPKSVKIRLNNRSAHLHQPSSPAARIWLSHQQLLSSAWQTLVTQKSVKLPTSATGMTEIWINALFSQTYLSLKLRSTNGWVDPRISCTRRMRCATRLKGLGNCKRALRRRKSVRLDQRFLVALQRPIPRHLNVSMKTQNSTKWKDEGYK